ncbi:hypothetical protein NIES2098_56550 [Calothrix sp. NIES-2098]|nr:hypothetical protein NIES2098_56550 [Calothrix sp. NIES-2098]
MGAVPIQRIYVLQTLFELVLISNYVMNGDLNPTHNVTTHLRLGTLTLGLITNYELVIMLNAQPLEKNSACMVLLKIGEY